MREVVDKLEILKGTIKSVSIRAAGVAFLGLILGHATWLRSADLLRVLDEGP